MENRNPYMPPAAELNDANSGPELASRWARLGGALIDGILVALVFWPAMVAVGYWDKATTSGLTIADNLLLGLFGLLVFLALNGYLLARSGQTLGKRILGTRIVSVESGQLLPLSKLIALRYLPIQAASLIPIGGQLAGFINALFIFGRDKRCVHDLIAGTHVIRVESGNR